MRSYKTMTEPVTNLGKDLNTTFLPQALLRKTDNKANSTLTNKCKCYYMQTNFKKHPGILLSQLILLKSNMLDISLISHTQLQFV